MKSKWKNISPKWKKKIINVFQRIIKKDGFSSKPSFFISLKKKSTMYKILAQINKLILPSFTKQRLDLSKAKKWQMAIIGYRYYVTTKALD
jgi:hypothetical protein